MALTDADVAKIFAYKPSGSTYSVGTLIANASKGADQATATNKALTALQTSVSAIKPPTVAQIVSGVVSSPEIKGIIKSLAAESGVPSQVISDMIKSSVADALQAVKQP